MRTLWLVAIGAIAVAALVVLAVDPEQPWAIGIVVVALGAAAGALAALFQLRSRGRRRRAGLHGLAARRGLEVAAAVSLLLWLRVVDGLSLVTAAFVVGTF